MSFARLRFHSDVQGHNQGSKVHLRGLRGHLLHIVTFLLKKWLNNLQNSGDPDQMPHYVASDLGLHFFPIPL